MRKCEGRQASPKLKTPRQMEGENVIKWVAAVFGCQGDVDFILQATELLRSELGRALLKEVDCLKVDSDWEGLRWKPAGGPQG